MLTDADHRRVRGERQTSTARTSSTAAFWACPASRQHHSRTSTTPMARPPLTRVQQVVTAPYTALAGPSPTSARRSPPSPRAASSSPASRASSRTRPASRPRRRRTDRLVPTGRRPVSRSHRAESTPPRSPSGCARSAQAPAPHHDAEGPRAPPISSPRERLHRPSRRGAPDFTGDAPGAFLGYGRALGAEQVSVNIRVLAPHTAHVPPGGDPTRGHSHRTIEEIYLVLDGELTVSSATMRRPPALGRRLHPSSRPRARCATTRTARRRS